MLQCDHDISCFVVLSLPPPIVLFFLLVLSVHGVLLSVESARSSLRLIGNITSTAISHLVGISCDISWLLL